MTEKKGMDKERKKRIFRLALVSSLVVYAVLVALYFASGGWRALSFGKRDPSAAATREAAYGRPERILSLAPSITETLYALGLSDRIVGVTRNCNYPPECLKKPRVGDIYLDYEQVVKMKPDLIISEDTVRQEAAAKLKKLGFRILSVNCRTLAEFKSGLLLMGKATQTQAESRRILDSMEKIMASVQEKVKSVSLSKRPRVFVEIWNEPLMTAGRQTIISELVEMAGGINIGNELGAGFPRLSQETVLTKNPGIILLTTSSVEEVLGKKTWRQIRAVREGRVYRIDPDILVRPTPRMVQGLLKMARWFHPGLEF